MGSGSNGESFQGYYESPRRFGVAHAGGFAIARVKKKYLFSQINYIFLVFIWKILQKSSSTGSLYSSPIKSYTEGTNDKRQQTDIALYRLNRPRG